MVDRQWIIETLKLRVVEIAFKKVDGSDRRMRCTLNPDIIEAGGGTPQPKVVTRPDGSTITQSMTEESNGDVILHRVVTSNTGVIIEETTETVDNKSDSQVVKVWDTEKSAWRSFRWENFIGIAVGDKIQ